MPATSIDTLLACSVMVVLVLSSMAGVAQIVHPYLQNPRSAYMSEIGQEVAENLLVQTGTPSGWGSETNTSLTSFGLAKVNSTVPFELDIDKVTRLNNENAYNMSFWSVFTATGTKDRPFRIKVNPVFDVTLRLASQVQGGSDTVYRFDVYTKKSSLPIAATLSCYAVVRDRIVNKTASTSISGEGSVEVTLPNSANGTAALIVVARAEPRIVSYAVYPFMHNSTDDPYPQRTFARLSPLNYTLKAEYSYPNRTILSVRVLTYDYHFNLTKSSNGTDTEYYSIPRLLGPSPMILVVTGLNQSASFVEWVAYPQIPLDFGSDFTGEHDVMDSSSSRFLVTINSAVYECEAMIGGA